MEIRRDVPPHSNSGLKARWGRVLRSIIIVGLAIFNSDKTLDIAEWSANQGIAATVILVSILWFGLGLSIKLEDDLRN